jgi:FkbM family methyltransferase
MLLAMVERCGVVGALKLLTARKKLRWLLPPTSTVSIRGLRYPFHFRRVSTDKYVIAEVLLGDQYQCLANFTDVRTIVDAGANIGTTSAFLLNRYPEARVIALEPDAKNFAVLQRNLEPYGARAVAVRAALWPQQQELWVDRGHFRDGGDWSTQVTARPLPGADVVSGLSLGDLMSRFTIDRIDILKIDIEGAERQILNASFAGLIDRIENIAIELHDRECQELFASVLAGRGGITTHQGEVTLWRSQRHHTASDGAAG